LGRNRLRHLRPWQIGTFSFEVPGDLHDLLEFASIQPDTFGFWANIDLHTTFVDFDEAHTLNNGWKEKS
jgi:hypothetical protein